MPAMLIVTAMLFTTDMLIATTMSIVPTMSITTTMLIMIAMLITTAMLIMITTKWANWGSWKWSLKWQIQSWNQKYRCFTTVMKMHSLFVTDFWLECYECVKFQDFIRFIVYQIFGIYQIFLWTLIQLFSPTVHYFDHDCNVDCHCIV